MTEALRLAVFDDSTSISVLPFFEIARSSCTIVWVVGWSPKRHPTRLLSRFGEVADVTGMTNIQAIEYLTSLRLDGVVVFNDPPIRLAAAVAERLDLPFHSPRTAELLTDKLAQRTALQNAGMPVPAFAAIRHGEAPTGVPFPAVLKPRAGAGSRATFRVHSAKEVSDALATCDPDEEFILEEWLPDKSDEHGLACDIVSVESIARDGVIEHLMVTGRFPFAPPFRETGLFMPSDFDEADKDAAAELTGLALEAVGVRNGLLHTEIKMTPYGPRIIEINGRLGGGLHQLMDRIGGPSLHAWAMQLALGEDIGPVPALPDSPVAFFHQVQAPQFATEVVRIEGLDTLAALPGVQQVQVKRPPGSVLDSKKGGVVDHVVKIDGLVATHDELLLLNQRIMSTLQFTWRYQDETEESSARVSA